MKKALIYMLAALVSAAVFAGCVQNTGTAQTGKDDGSLSVVTTIFPPYDFARAVAGGKADITMLIDPGAEVHTFDPTPEDIISIQKCDVFIYTGGENDAWVDTVLQSIDTGSKQIVRLMDTVTPLEEEIVEGMQDDGHEDEEGDEEHRGEYDEHIWTSPKNAMLMVDAIAEAMGKADAANAPVYKQNASDYTAQISEVDERIRGIVDSAAHRLILVADRFPFRYLADEYGLEYSAAFSGCSAESEVSGGTMRYLINKVKENSIGYIYTIEFSNRKVAGAVAEQTGAEVLLLHSCHNVTKDEFDKGVTYVSLMRQNADNLEKGLN